MFLLYIFFSNILLSLSPSSTLLTEQHTTITDSIYDQNILMLLANPSAELVDEIKKDCFRFVNVCCQKVKKGDLPLACIEDALLYFIANKHFDILKQLMQAVEFADFLSYILSQKMYKDKSLTLFYDNDKDSLILLRMIRTYLPHFFKHNVNFGIALKATLSEISLNPSAKYSLEVIKEWIRFFALWNQYIYTNDEDKRSLNWDYICSSITFLTPSYRDCLMDFIIWNYRDIFKLKVTREKPATHHPIYTLIPLSLHFKKYLILTQKESLYINPKRKARFSTQWESSLLNRIISVGGVDALHSLLNYAPDEIARYHQVVFHKLLEDISNESHFLTLSRIEMLLFFLDYDYLNIIIYFERLISIRTQLLTPCSSLSLRLFSGMLKRSEIIREKLLDLLTAKIVLSLSQCFFEENTPFREIWSKFYILYEHLYQHSSFTVKKNHQLKGLCLLLAPLKYPKDYESNFLQDYTRWSFCDVISCFSYFLKYPSQFDKAPAFIQRNIKLILESQMYEKGIQQWLGRISLLFYNPEKDGAFSFCFFGDTSRSFLLELSSHIPLEDLQEASLNAFEEKDALFKSKKSCQFMYRKEHRESPPALQSLAATFLDFPALMGEEILPTHLLPSYEIQSDGYRLRCYVDQDSSDLYGLRHNSRKVKPLKKICAPHNRPS